MSRRYLVKNVEATSRSDFDHFANLQEGFFAPSKLHRKLRESLGEVAEADHTVHWLACSL